LRDESGTSAIEYAIIASGVSIVIVGTVATLGTAVNRDSPDDSGAEVNILRFSDLPAR
jgi:hypothetical protein